MTPINPGRSLEPAPSAPFGQPNGQPPRQPARESSSRKLLSCAVWSIISSPPTEENFDPATLADLPTVWPLVSLCPSARLMTSCPKRRDTRASEERKVYGKPIEEKVYDRGL